MRDAWVPVARVAALLAVSALFPASGRPAICSRWGKASRDHFALGQRRAGGSCTGTRVRGWGGGSDTGGSWGCGFGSWILGGDVGCLRSSGTGGIGVDGGMGAMRRVLLMLLRRTHRRAARAGLSSCQVQYDGMAPTKFNATPDCQAGPTAARSLVLQPGVAEVGRLTVCLWHYSAKPRAHEDKEVPQPVPPKPAQPVPDQPDAARMAQPHSAQPRP